MIRLRKDVFLAILQQEIGFFDQIQTGELINRLTSDTTLLQEAATTDLALAIQYFATLVGTSSLSSLSTETMKGVC